MENFTPYSALIGGALIGLSATVLLLFNGRIAGLSGIVNGAVESSGDRSWRWLFLLGVVGGALLHQLTLGPAFALREGYSPLLLGVAAFLVGFGTRMGNGCTSGHGVCGIGRLSVRSIVATLTFLGAGIVTVTVARQLLGVSL
ncbi:MAG: YeeE/YedE thiosulfate transporter family protein [Pseudomonadota bacterium]|nr:YeeE/YedE thiosulfate transporter family protein [Pseudomonadota bacterium]